MHCSAAAREDRQAPGSPTPSEAGSGRAAGLIFSPRSPLQAISGQASNSTGAVPPLHTEIGPIPGSGPGIHKSSPQALPSVSAPPVAPGQVTPSSSTPAVLVILSRSGGGGIPGRLLPGDPRVGGPLFQGPLSRSPMSWASIREKGDTSLGAPPTRGFALLFLGCGRLPPPSSCDPRGQPLGRSYSRAQGRPFQAHAPGAPVCGLLVWCSRPQVSRGVSRGPGQPSKRVRHLPLLGLRTPAPPTGRQFGVPSARVLSLCSLLRCASGEGAHAPRSRH
ncbi:hypothetical protein NDU88_000163 [Pleurodeles waltl]|uniref:Uncharacterized protein n=1 Tax=Pleurodeles waltl TaxID=8319 RepID=A0AAV7UQV2_PLEWA|nr:hypothetical protein NDU88_000163 [Pleurodeles waltl]